jgi:hypothetical protein
MKQLEVKTLIKLVEVSKARKHFEFKFSFVFLVPLVCNVMP